MKHARLCDHKTQTTKINKRQKISLEVFVPWDIKYFSLALECNNSILEAYAKTIYRRVESKDSIKYYRGNKLHREDGPAIEWANGTKEWFRNGQYHREDGPAFIQSDGTTFWLRNGQLHREDGPAIEWADGNKEWWRNGQRYDNPAIK
jgi:hypothetical protein